jgi:hypothetical protein
MGHIVYTFYPACAIILAILGTSFAAEEVNLYDVFMCYDISWVMESRRICWVGHVARLEDGDRVYTGYWCRDLIKKTTWKN